MKTFTYYAISACFDGKILAEEITRTIDDIASEAHHYNIKTLGELVKRWDALGKNMKKYRYFLISKDRSIY